MGGSACIRLGSKDLVDTLVVCHPGGCSIEELKAIKVLNSIFLSSFVVLNLFFTRSRPPSSAPKVLFFCLLILLRFSTFVHLIEDSMFKPELRSKAEAIFAARKDKEDFIDYEFVEYKGPSR